MCSISSKSMFFLGIFCICAFSLLITYIYLMKIPTTMFISHSFTTVRGRRDFDGQNQLVCLLDAQKAFEKLNVSWFITFGSALFYHRNGSFNTDDIDTGIFYEDFIPAADKIVATFSSYRFRCLSTYGTVHHGQEWTFMCPSVNVKLDIFVFYPPLKSDPTSPTITWWSASYNGECNKKRFKKCRWQFSSFVPETLNISNISFSIVPESFLVEQYGKNWTKPIAYTYHDSISFLPNLIKE